VVYLSLEVQFGQRVEEMRLITFEVLCALTATDYEKRLVPCEVPVPFLYIFRHIQLQPLYRGVILTIGTGTDEAAVEEPAAVGSAAAAIGATVLRTGEPPYMCSECNVVSLFDFNSTLSYRMWCGAWVD
jgi:hypothetical protein